MAASGVVTTPAQRSANGARDARMSGLLLLGLGVATAGLHSILTGPGWWFGAFGVALVVAGTSAIARYFLRPRWLPSLVGAVFGVAVLTLGFAANTAILGVIPTRATIERIGSLVSMANDSIAHQGVPAIATDGIQFLICSAIAGIALAMDIVAVWWRLPAVAGVPLLIIAAVPSVVRSTLSDPVLFELTAIVYLFIIRTRLRRIQSGLAFGVGAVAVLGALVVPIVLPPVAAADAAGSGIGGLAESINPIINLGDDLRKTIPTPALTYTTTSDTGLYLRLTTLETFVGKEWAPVAPKPIKGNTVAAIGAPPGLSAAVKRQTISTNIQIQNTTGEWLPVPYPSKKITGLSGNWFWEPKALAVLTNDSNMQGQTYTVKSLDIEPTKEQLEAAPRSANSPLAAVPKGLSPIVAATAKKVVGSAKTDFDKAIALQNWFRSTFTYSIHTPALAGFDGSGLDVIVPFLQTKSGYCIHFATTMAVMARTLGIPSRVAVGFLPGTAAKNKGEESTVYEVSSNDLHAWPELYFKGVGWVRFEPTPSRGFKPTFPDAPTNAATGTPTSAPTAGATPAPTAAPNGASRLAKDLAQTQSQSSTTSSAASANWGPLALLVLVLLLLGPAVVRARIRRRRIDAVRNGENSAITVWQELRESSRDLDIDARSSATPRELSDFLDAYLTERLNWNPQLAAESRAALAQLRQMVEEESFTSLRLPYARDRMADALRMVLSGLRRASSNRARFAATFLPVTLVDRALGRGAVRV